MTANTIETLRGEHRDMQKLLDLLAHQIELMAEGRRPDFELLTEIVDYFRSYPDLYHHSKEELVARELLAHEKEHAAIVQRLEQEHKQCDAQLARLSRALVSMLMEPQGHQRELFQTAANEFLEHERAHITWEDTEFFNLAEQELSDEAWHRIDDKVARLSLPGFEKEAHARLTEMEAVVHGWRGL